MEKVGQSCKNFSILSQGAQLIWLTNNESDDIINLLSRYIYDCFKLRYDFTLCIASSPKVCPFNYKAKKFDSMYL